MKELSQVDEAPAAPAPDINAFLDAAESGSTPDPAPAADTTAPAAPAADPTPADPFDSGADTFDRAYVEKLRKEAADRRTKVKPYEDAFDGIADSDREALLGFAGLYKADPVAAAQWMLENGQALLDALGGDQPPADQPPAADGEDRPLTRAELDRYMAEKEQQRAQEAAVAQVHSEVQALGLDPNSVDGQTLMLRALQEHGGDIAAAHKALEESKAAERQKIIDDYLADKAKGAEQPSPVTQAAGPAPATGEIHGLKDSKAKLNAWLIDQGMKG